MENPQAEQPQAQQGQDRPWYLQLARFVLLYYLFNFIRHNFFQTTPEPSTYDDANIIRVSPQELSPHHVIPHNATDTPIIPSQRPPITQQYSFPAKNLWPDHIGFTFSVYVSPYDAVSIPDLLSRHEDPTDLTKRVTQQRHQYKWYEDLTAFGRPVMDREVTVNLAEIHPEYLPMLAQHNQTLYAHVVLENDVKPRRESCDVIHLVDPINRYVYQKKPIVKKPKTLAESDTPGTRAENDNKNKNENSPSPSVPSSLPPAQHGLDLLPSATPVDIHHTNSFLVPDLFVRVLYDFSVFKSNEIPVPFRHVYHIDYDYKGYAPPSYIDRFWSLQDDYIQLTNNSTLLADGALPLTIRYAPTSLMRFQFQQTMVQAWDQQVGMGMTSSREIDKLKSIILDTNPFLLFVTISVSLLHSLFEFLAFRNDVKHWKDVESGHGVSIYSLFYNAISQLVIFLYLYDNDTSFVVLMSTGVGVIIEAWKITKAQDLVVNLTYPYIHRKLPAVSDSDADGKQGDATPTPFIDDETAKYDKEAFKYLGFVMIPLCIGYTAYTLATRDDEVISWYSWCLNTLVSYIYMFGFLMMTPQLYLNYKLKTVAHMPWRVMVYKSLNTVVDDLFSFVIKMPALHRLACFRDDIIFLIFLYQKWIYRVDYSRANEFGQVYDELSDSTKPSGDSAPSSSPTPVSPESEVSPRDSKADESAVDDDDDDSESVESVDVTPLATTATTEARPSHVPSLEKKLSSKLPVVNKRHHFEGDTDSGSDEEIEPWVLENQLRLRKMREEQQQQQQQQQQQKKTKE